MFTIPHTTYKSIFFALLATAVHWISFFILLQFHFPPNLATFLGALIGALTNYCLQFYIVFKNTSSHHHSSLRYLLLLVLNIPANSLLFAVIHHLLFSNLFLAQLLTSALIALSNLCFYQKAIFNERVNY